MNQPIVLSGVVVDRCPISGCGIRLRDKTGTIFIDLAPNRLSAQAIPIGARVLVKGNIGKTREGGAGFVASSIEAPAPGA